ncbi:hypothetical protein IJI72_03080 [Candidatus Saccharibacteria bacterium]|nr:hypothetical protein [Candidatus Saccharibacteria bacterium]
MENIKLAETKPPNSPFRQKHTLSPLSVATIFTRIPLHLKRRTMSILRHNAYA